MKKNTNVTKRLPVKKDRLGAKMAAPTAKPANSPTDPAIHSSVTHSPVVHGPVTHKHILYMEVTPDKYFVMCDGRRIKNVKELADILQLINDDMFKYHVTDTKNDFSNWINDVFGEPELAKKIKTVRNRLETSIEMYRFMFSMLEKDIKR